MKFFLKAAIAVALFAICHATSIAETYISDTKYDWSGLANSITSASKPNYDKARDIYDWITKNIDYDTSYAIHGADATYESKRGVCQGYCELFYRLAESVGLRCEIIFGKSKDMNGNIGDIGHAWIFAYTHDNSGILVDPTWGAGSVDGGIFTRHISDAWFHVDPHWMIFTHFPDNEAFQLIDNKIDYTTFRHLPAFYPSLGKYGYKAADFLSLCLSGMPPAVPKFYDQAVERHTRAVQLPKEATLHVGTNYDFFLLPRGGSRFVINNEGNRLDSWSDNGEYKGLRFMPSKAGKLEVGVYNPNGSWSYLVEYDVATPTEAEIESLERAYPLLSPKFSSLENFNSRTFEQLGVDAAKVLRAVKSEGISTLPKMYPQVGSRPVDVPWNGRLKAGRAYTFTLTQGKGKKFAIVNNDVWQTEWIQDPATGNIILTIDNAAPGTLSIFADTDGANSYRGILQYTVE